MANVVLWTDFIAASKPCVEAFDVFAHKYDLEGKAEADHICYKCATKESFEGIRALCEAQSEFIYQSIISHRRIAVVKFLEPIVTVLGPVWYLELSDQKPDLSQKDGFDHIEAYPITQRYEDFVAGLMKTETVIHIARPHHTTDDVVLPGGYIFRCTQGKLIEKIKNEEM